MAPFSILTAPIGARLAHKLPVALLKRVFAVMLMGLALQMVYAVFTA
ncbi:Sulfite exporter TauE/SafE [Halomonas chromatireducens]|uniref:Sulfite exporter TauE/SafE n=2 Tax=Halomonadaceae TaxID=28256 RepID=A0A0X8HFT9_9GAMM|nr:Sulfite exporter TauE/SafE [Halomonas chromatireducens]